MRALVERAWRLQRVVMQFARNAMVCFFLPSRDRADGVAQARRLAAQEYGAKSVRNVRRGKYTVDNTSAG